MRSNVFTLSKNVSDMEYIPLEAEKVARYNDLDEKESLRLRLLAEELICMLPQLLNYGSGSFWIENKRNEYELHVDITPTDFARIDRDKLLSVSSTGKNAAAVGIVSKICIAVEKMISERSKLTNDVPYDFYDMGMCEYGDYKAWSLMNYRNCVNSKYKNEEEEQPEIDEKRFELERSILVTVADDVTVGIKGGKVDIVVKKKF